MLPNAMGTIECIAQTQPAKVRAGCLRRSASTRFAAQFGELARGLDHERRFVALAALRHRREIRCVGFDQHPIGGREARGLLNVERFGKRHDAAEAEMKSELERLFGFRRPSGKTVHDAAETRWRPMLTQQGNRIVPRFARMNDDRLPRVARDAHLLDEDARAARRAAKNRSDNRGRFLPTLPLSDASAAPRAACNVSSFALAASCG